MNTFPQTNNPNIVNDISGTVYTTNTVSPFFSNSSAVSIAPAITATNDSVTVNGSLVINGDISVNGESIIDRLSRIEKLVNIPTRNIDIENKYPKLKEIWKMYNQELEKYITWETLKK